jgi:hypothetical protein
VAEQGYRSVQAVVASGASVVTLSGIGLDYAVRSYRAKTGQVQWDTPLGVTAGFVTRSFAVKGRRAVVGTAGGVVALDTRGGGVAWDSPTAGLAAAIRGKTAYVPGYGGTAAFPIR